MKRKLCFAAAAFVFMMGIFLTVTRKDPIEKNIGYVYLNHGDTETALKGQKISALYKNKIIEYDHNDLKEIADDLLEIKVTKENKSDIKLSFRKKFTGKVKYNIFDDNFDMISKAQEKIYFSGNKKGKYYVSMDVSWGDNKENILVRYFFIVNIS